MDNIYSTEAFLKFINPNYEDIKFARVIMWTVAFINCFVKQKENIAWTLTITLPFHATFCLAIVDQASWIIHQLSVISLRSWKSSNMVGVLDTVVF